MPTRPALLVRIDDRDGCFGWGEIWANFPPRANQHKAHLVEDVITPKLLGASYSDPREIATRLREELSIYFLHVGQRKVFEHILAGIDIALWDLSLRKAGQSFAEFMGLSQTASPTYASSINVDDLERLIPYHASLGQTYFKLKIGFLEASDFSLVKRAVEFCPPYGRIMVDSNQSWKLPEAAKALQSLEEFTPLFAEEPLAANADLRDWEALARATRIPLAGGENIYGLDGFRRMTDAGMRFVQPDVAKWGGITGTLDLARVLPSGIHLWPHFMGTAIGQAAALAVTSAVDNCSCCEMDVNPNRLRTELCGEVFSIRRGAVPLSSDPGCVLPPTCERLAEFCD